MLRLAASIVGVAAVTALAFFLIPHNVTAAGFAYLLLVLVIASTWGLAEATLASIAATLAFNLAFLPPIGRLTIAEPQNWVALFSFLFTALIASRLSARIKKQALDAVERQRDLERLYAFSRAILLTDPAEPVARQLVRKIAEIFSLSAAALYDRRSGEVFRAGPSDFDGFNDQLRDAASQGASFSDPAHKRVVTAVRLGSEPIGSFAIQGVFVQDSVLQGIANLIAIGLERARAQDLAHQIEAARRSEQLRTTLIDAMAHEFKTPLTSIRAATSSLLSSPDQPIADRTELLQVADEEARHLQTLIDDAVEMARLEGDHIQIRREPADPKQLVEEVIASLHTQIEDRPVDVRADAAPPLVPLDRRLMKLALKQMLDNALKYSPPRSPVSVVVSNGTGAVNFEVVDHGPGIPEQEQHRLFERFYRSPSVKNKVPGFGLGLAIASSVVQAHGGELAVSSHPGETTFRITLPLNAADAKRAAR